MSRGSFVNPQKKQILKETLQIQHIKEVWTKIQPNFVLKIVTSYLDNIFPRFLYDEVFLAALAALYLEGIT